MKHGIVLALAVAIALVASELRACAQPAPALTSVQAVAAATNPSRTFLNVTTQEMGYATNQIATFNGVRMTQIGYTAITNGRSIVGYTRVWQYNGTFAGGTFTYSATSIVVPIRTLSLSCRIQ